MVPYIHYKPLPVTFKWDLGKWTNMLWKGNIVLMRKGISHELVNIHTSDASLADFAVKK